MQPPKKNEPKRAVLTEDRPTSGLNPTPTSLPLQERETKQQESCTSGNCGCQPQKRKLLNE